MKESSRISTVDPKKFNQALESLQKGESVILSGRCPRWEARRLKDEKRDKCGVQINQVPPCLDCKARQITFGMIKNEITHLIRENYKGQTVIIEVEDVQPKEINPNICSNRTAKKIKTPLGSIIYTQGNTIIPKDGEKSYPGVFRFDVIPAK